MKRVLILLAAAACLLWQVWELKKFRVSSYTVTSPKLKNEVRLAVLADLHGFEYGKKNVYLINAVNACRPDLILIPGDCIVSKEEGSYEIAKGLMGRLVGIAPVFYSYGNHESWAEEKMEQDFQAYLRGVEAAGAKVLRNENVIVRARGQSLAVAGAEIPLDYYKKGKEIPLEPDYLNKHLGIRMLRQAPWQNLFQILLAHNPYYAKDYAAWGADLTVCGHNHGGLIDIPILGPLFSPQLTLFPKYNYGGFDLSGKKVMVSRGLGTHTFHIRINNRAELLSLRLLPAEKVKRA